MKMLTLWACLEPAENPATQPQATLPMAWKQAWQIAGETVKSSSENRAATEITAPRQPVT